VTRALPAGKCRSVGWVIPVSAPPRVAAHLRSVRDGPLRLLHRGPDAVYLDVHGRCVGVVGRRATAVPCAVRTVLDRLPEVVAASVRGGVLHLDDQPLVVGRLVDVSVPPLRRTGAPGEIDVAALVGRGDGLTPYGDDVLCGWLAAHRAAGLATPEADAAVRALLARTTLLSATLLDCAMQGEVIPEFAAWVAALGTAAEESRAAALARVGHTSGRGLLEGATRAIEGWERVAA
jgi:uncharacterized protein DUF2877